MKRLHHSFLMSTRYFKVERHECDTFFLGGVGRGLVKDTVNIDKQPVKERLYGAN